MVLQTELSFTFRYTHVDIESIPFVHWTQLHNHNILAIDSISIEFISINTLNALLI